MISIIIKIIIFIAVFTVSYNIVEPESFGGYLLVFVVVGLISIGITFSFLGLMLLLGLISKLFIRD